METKFLIKQLNQLKAIEPDPVFLKWSRRVILAASITAPRRTAFSFKLIMPFALGALATIIALIASPATTPAPDPQKSKTVASLNPDAIKLEESAVARERKLTDAGYYKNLTPAITLALNDIIEPNTNWQSSEHLQHIARHYE